MSSFYRGPKDLASDNESYAIRRDNSEASFNDLYQSCINVAVNPVFGVRSVFVPLPTIDSQTTFTHASMHCIGSTNALTFTKLVAGIYVLEEGKSAIQFLPTSLVTFTGTTGDGTEAQAITMNGVFQTPTGFTLYPRNQYFLWYYLVTPSTQDFRGTKSKTFTNGAGQTPVPVVQLSTRQALTVAQSIVPLITFSSDRGFTFFKDP